MGTLVAYTFAHDSAARAAAGRARVETYYGGESGHHGYAGTAVGLHLWDSRDSTSWHDAGASVNLTEDRLELSTDSTGVSRLFELQLPDGCVWTNRPVAALLFAGVPAVASTRGWTFAASCGWFMDDSTPYDGVLAVPGGTHIVADGHRQQRTTKAYVLEATTAAPTQVVATLYAKAEPVELIKRALSWHRYGEGLQPASSLFDTPPDGFITSAPVGEVAHGYFYPRDVQQLDELPLPDKLRAFSNHLQTRLIPAAGPTQAARAAVTEQIDRVLRAAVDSGIENATMLDYFYAVEPLRRGATPFTPVRRNLASAADRDLIEPLLTDVEGFGDLSTLWAASVAGASSAAAEATLRQALCRATFNQHLAKANRPQ
ncbi:hypothetical protein EV645_1472 [Kribbella rubisoli]|uniref:Uncharacterized protein n=1 Tax=Kribbella rubisoli TaxID=3075929 RepID=A0A4Q7X840_9ACTN|nr:hypothetical protein [Kribbella rubisoli]RZU19261.1 hypothetical protein EV645_1472 [Kribbella rubisoli]